MLDCCRFPLPSVVHLRSRTVFHALFFLLTPIRKCERSNRGESQLERTRAALVTSPLTGDRREGRGLLNIHVSHLLDNLPPYDKQYPPPSK